ncbi:MAG TPA: hypothetical protein VMV69_03015 [Pirellulales bacterium]|nr:hypothetical protein [Pirellulales bacterium]
MYAFDTWQAIDDDSMTSMAGVAVGPRLADGHASDDNDRRNGAEALRAVWRSMIEETLNAWQRNPGELDDDGVRPPATDTIELARRLARRLCERGSPAPTGIVPNGSGGITFERHHGLSLETFRILADHSIELLVFEDCRLVSRRPILADHL